MGALVVTGDRPVSEEILALARERRVSVIAVPHHTYTTVRLILLSTPVRYVMRTEVPTCGPDDLVEDVRERLRSGAARSLVVVGEDRTVAGHLRRADLLMPVHRRVVLVDHNERGQAVPGIEEADVVMFVTLLAGEPAVKAKLPLRSSTEKLEVLAIKNRAALILCHRKPNGFFSFPNSFFEKHFRVTATTRNWNTVQRIVALAKASSEAE